MSELEVKKSLGLPGILESSIADEPRIASSIDWQVSLLRLLWCRRRFLLLIASAGMLIFGVIAFVISNRYESKTQLMPPDQNSPGIATLLASASGSNTGLGSLATGSLGSGLLGLRSSGDLFVGIMQSRTVQDDVIGKFNLRKIYRDRRWEDARKELANNIDIGEDRKSGIITISVIDKNPQRAAAMAREYIEELNRIVTDSNTSSAHRERIFLEERLGEVKEGLEAAEKKFSQFASKNTAIDVPEQSKAMVGAAATLQGQLIATESELEALKQIYTDNNVRVRSLTARVAELHHELGKLVGNGENTSAIPGQQGEPPYPSIRELPLLGVTYADLYRQTKVQEAVFQSLTQEYELTKVEEAKEIPTVQVLAPPNVPEQKVFPPRLLIIFAGTSIFLIGAAASVVVNASWQELDPRDPRKVLAKEMWDSARAKRFWASHNGSGLRRLSSNPIRDPYDEKKPIRES